MQPLSGLAIPWIATMASGADAGRSQRHRIGVTPIPASAMPDDSAMRVACSGRAARPPEPAVYRRPPCLQGRRAVIRDFRAVLEARALRSADSRIVVVAWAEATPPACPPDQARALAFSFADSSCAMVPGFAVAEHVDDDVKEDDQLSDEQERRED